MWIFTTSGFISAVQDWHDPSRVLVRARDRTSLESLAAATGEVIHASPAADYPYRTSATKGDFAHWVATEAGAIDYPNFKSEVAAIRGDDYAHVLMGVWSTMHDAEDASARTATGEPKQ